MSRSKKTTQGQINGEPVKYAAFDINGSLEFPEGRLGAEDGDDSTVSYSSKVTYQQEVRKNFAFWKVMNKVIVGARYYTEHDDGSGLVQTSVSYERTIEYEKRDLVGGYIRDLMKGLFIRPGSYTPQYRADSVRDGNTIRDRSG